MSRANQRLVALDAADSEAAVRDLLTCCGCKAWAVRMAAQRPFGTVEGLIEAADRIWWDLTTDDWLEAYRCHPRIGERKAETPQSGREREWSEGEQAGTAAAAATTLEQLAAVNRQYEERFGYVYLVCATGKTAEEMLAMARERFGNAPDDEIRVAAEQQRQITQIRLHKLLES